MYTPLRRQTEEAVGGRRGENAGPERSLAPAEHPALGGGGPRYFCFSFASRCLTPEGTAPQSEAAGAVTMSTTGAESIRDEEAAPGPVAVTGHGGVGGKTATTSVPGATMTARQTGERTTGGTVAATGAMTTAGIGATRTTTRTTAIPTSTTGRTAVTAASAAAGGGTGGAGGAAGRSAARPRTAAGEPRV